MKKISIMIIFSMFMVNAFAKPYTSSKKCSDFIKEYEKCMLTAYWDSNGYSIGYGHHSKDVKANDVISQEEANSYLKSDIKVAEKYVNYLISKLPYTYKFSQGFIDGFTSFVYNVGVGNAEESLFYQRLMRCRVKNGIMDKSDYNFTVCAIKTSCIRAKGHIKRRNGEYKMMIN